MTSQQRILLIGGHGKVALLAIPLLVQAGHQVDAVIRNPDHQQEVSAAGAHPVVADVETLDLEALTDLAAGHDVVIWSAGAGGGNPARTKAVDQDAAIRTIDAAQQAGVPRFVMVSYHGARLDHGVAKDNPFFHYAQAKALADEHLRASGLAWTILGPSALTLDTGTGAIDVDGPAAQVTRADVAQVLTQTVERTDLAGLTIRFNNGSTPIRQALDRLR